MTIKWHQKTSQIITGEICFEKSTEHFADNDLGSGSTVELHHKIGDCFSVFLARIQWLDWNHFRYEAIDHSVPYLSFPRRSFQLEGQEVCGA